MCKKSKSTTFSYNEVSLILFLPVSDSQGVQVAQSGEKLPENMEAFQKGDILLGFFIDALLLCVV